MYWGLTKERNFEQRSRDNLFNEIVKILNTLRDENFSTEKFFHLI